MDIELFFTNARLLGNAVSPFQPYFWTSEHWKTLLNIFPNDQLFFLSLFFLGVVGIFLFGIIMISHIGLIDAFYNYSQSSARKRISTYALGQALEKSRHYFWRVTGVNVVSRVVSYLLLGLSALPLFYNDSALGKLGYSALLYLVCIPVIIVISLITKYAENYIVLNNLNPREAVRQAIQLFMKNVGVSVELALLMFVLFFFVNIAAITAAVFVTAPFFLFALSAVGTLQAGVSFSLYYFVLYMAIVLSMGISAVVFSTWHFGNWTLLFLDLTKGKRRSKIHRLLKGEK